MTASQTRFEASIILDDGSVIAAARDRSRWSLSWGKHRWEGRSLVALVSELPGPGLGPDDESLGQVIDALIAAIDRPAAVDRCLRSHIGNHF
jgi:hypothetical protein